MTDECDRVPPHSLAAERSVIGCAVVASAECMAELAELRPDDFFLPAHVEAWEAILALVGRGIGVNMVSVQDELRARGTIQRFDGGLSWVSGVAMSAPLVMQAGAHAATVRKMATLRRLIGLCQETACRCYNMAEADDVLADMRAGVASLEVAASSVGPVSVADALPPVLEEILARPERKNDHVARSGIEEVDIITGGFRRGHVVVVAGLPGMGKTAAAGGILAHNALNGVPCLLFSLEMDRQEIIERLLSLRSHVPATDLATGRATKNQEAWSKVLSANGEITTYPLWLDDRPLTLNQICGEAHRWYAKHVRARGREMALIAVDFLGLVRSEESSENRNREVAKMAQRFKLLAKALRIPVMVLSQLSRKAAERGGEPILSDLRDSGEVEAAADVVLFPWRDGDRARWIIAKNKSGACGGVDVAWHAERMEYASLRSGSEFYGHETRHGNG